MYIPEPFYTYYKIITGRFTYVEVIKMVNIEEFIQLSLLEDRLKKIRRTGWLKARIYHSESVAEHLHHSSLAALYLRNLLEVDIDWERVLILCIVHDLAEAITGDIPHPEKTDADREREYEHLKNILEALGISDIADEVENSNSIEHKIYKYSELLATYAQGIIYLKRGYGDRYLHEIIENMLERLKVLADELGLEKLKELHREMNRYYLKLRG